MSPAEFCHWLRQLQPEAVTGDGPTLTAEQWRLVRAALQGVREPIQTTTIPRGDSLRSRYVGGHP